MAAEVYFRFRRKPAQVIDLSFLYGKCRFRKIVFLCDILHKSIVYPVVQNTDGSRISFKNFIRKCVYNILSHSICTLPKKLLGYTNF